MRDRWLALVAGGIPLFFVLLLRIVNPSYLGHFFAIETRAIGLPIFVVIILLSILAYPCLLGSFVIYRTGRQGLGSALSITVLLVLVFPASLLVLLGPSAILMLSSSLNGVIP